MDHILRKKSLAVTRAGTTVNFSLVDLEKEHIKTLRACQTRIDALIDLVSDEDDLELDDLDEEEEEEDEIEDPSDYEDEPVEEDIDDEDEEEDEEGNDIEDDEDLDENFNPKRRMSNAVTA